MIWQPIVQFHDECLLWFVQEVFYARWWAAAPLMFAILVCLPSHRRAARLAAWLGAVWALWCLSLYGMLSEAPVFGWFLVALLCYRFLRWMLWILPAPVAGTAVRRHMLWAGPKAAWTSWVVRDYFRADPRGTYWLDLARAVRGAPIDRRPADRKNALVAAADLPAWRAVVWRAVFRVMEGWIGLYGRLPAWWHRPHDRLDLDEEHLRAILEGESESAYRAMLRSWTGADFDDYCRRDPARRAIEHQRAGQLGRIACLYGEALVEYATFRRPWRAGEIGLVEAAKACYEIWRRRCQFDMLWEHQLQPLAPYENKSINHRRTDCQSVLQPAEEALELPVGSEPPDRIGSSGIHASDPDAEIIAPPEESPNAPSPGSDGAEEQPADTEEQPADADLFAAFASAPSAAAASGDASEEDTARCRLSPREQQRLADLQDASAMLEAYLGLESRPQFSQAIEQIQPLLEDAASQRRLAANALLLLYCLRADFTGPGVDKQKVDQLTRFEARSLGPTTGNRSLDGQLRWIASMQIDLLFERGEFAQVVDWFREADELDAHGWRVLGDAESALASSLRGQEALRDMLRYDAIGHYFEAKFRGIWTLEYVQRLFDDIPDADAMLDLFREFPVDIARPGMLTWSAGQGPLRPPLAQAKASGKVVVEFSLAGSRGRGKRREISKFPWTFGQGPHVNTPLAPPARVAPVHIALWRHRGALIVTDKSEGKGMLVNGVRSRQSPLRPGDRVQFGNVMMEVVST